MRRIAGLIGVAALVAVALIGGGGGTASAEWCKNPTTALSPVQVDGEQAYLPIINCDERLAVLPVADNGGAFAVTASPRPDDFKSLSETMDVLYKGPRSAETKTTTFDQRWRLNPGDFIDHYSYSVAKVGDDWYLALGDRRTDRTWIQLGCRADGRSSAFIVLSNDIQAEEINGGVVQVTLFGRSIAATSFTAIATEGDAGDIVRIDIDRLSPYVDSGAGEMRLFWSQGTSPKTETFRFSGGQSIHKIGYETQVHRTVQLNESMFSVWRHIKWCGQSAETAN